MLNGAGCFCRWALSMIAALLLNLGNNTRMAKLHEIRRALYTQYRSNCLERRSERKKVTTRTSCRVSALDRSKDRQSRALEKDLETPGGGPATARDLKSTIYWEGILFQIRIHPDQLRRKGVNGEATCLRKRCHTFICFFKTSAIEMSW